MRLIAVGIAVMLAGLGLAAGGFAIAANDKQPAVPADKSAEQDDLAAMQGRWTYETTNKDGAVFRVEKLVKDKTQTVTQFDQNGNTIDARTAAFELKREGPFRLCTIRNMRVTAGPNLGHQEANPRSYAYRIENGTMLEVWGLLDTDHGAWRLTAWNRVKDK